MKVVYVGPRSKPGGAKYIIPNGRLVIGETYTVVGSTLHPFVSGILPAYFLAEKWRIRVDIDSPYYGQHVPFAANRFVPLEYYKAEFSISNHNEKESEQPK